MLMQNSSRKARIIASLSPFAPRRGLTRHATPRTLIGRRQKMVRYHEKRRPDGSVCHSSGHGRQHLHLRPARKPIPAGNDNGLKWFALAFRAVLKGPLPHAMSSLPEWQAEPRASGRPEWRSSSALRRTPTSFTPTRLAPRPWPSRMIVDPMAAGSPPGATNRSRPLPPPELSPHRDLITITPLCDPAFMPRSRSSSRPTRAFFSPGHAAPPAAPS